jgi:vacuolar-type H+-ATPase subunit D/Vma8
MIGSSAYENRKQELIRQALKGVQGLQIPKIEKPEIDEEQSEEIRLILIAFQHKFIPEMLLDVALIKAMLDGEKAAAFSRFSIDE